MEFQENDESRRTSPAPGDLLDKLRSQLQIGRDQIDRGEYVEFDEAGLREFFAGLQERGRRRYAEMNP